MHDHDKGHSGLGLLTRRASIFSASAKCWLTRFAKLVLDGLDAKSALSFALTCCTCAAGFAEHCLSVAKKCAEELMPTVSCLATEDDHKYTKLNLTICLEWKNGAALRKMYALSIVPGALDALWAAAWQAWATRLNNCSSQFKLTDLPKYNPKVCWVVVVSSNRFLQSRRFTELC